MEQYVKICGIQKLTLLDYPEHTACTLFVNGCNFRCAFCHNSELLGGNVEFYDEAEVFAFLAKRARVLEGVCVTGGEPTLYTDLDRLLGKIKDLGYSVKLDTNGYMPDRLAALIDAELVDYVAMDIKNSPDRYAETAGVPQDKFDISRIERSIEVVLDSAPDYEFRTTVVTELFDDKSIEGAARMILGAKKYYLQKFVMRDTVPSKTLTSPQSIVMSRYLNIAKRLIPNAQIRGEE
ncbi:MAG: anaerobic ribonucleoside-triphosphate reductase activating protein [Clostridiales bacterium]|nr:anaerobic ribonucleoside-triphosphate reductase activating protein [Clostridiales bacterium]